MTGGNFRKIKFNLKIKELENCEKLSLIFKIK